MASPALGKESHARLSLGQQPGVFCIMCSNLRESLISQWKCILSRASAMTVYLLYCVFSDGFPLFAKDFHYQNFIFAQVVYFLFYMAINLLPTFLLFSFFNRILLLLFWREVETRWPMRCVDILDCIGSAFSTSEFVCVCVCLRRGGIRTEEFSVHSES